MNNQVTRGYQKLVTPSAQPLPDPLHGLSAYERRSILLMTPTWSERHRMCKPGQTKEQRRDVLMDILFERRHAYDVEFHARCKRAELERANNRYLYNEQHLTEFKPAISTALKTVHDRRSDQDTREQNIRQDYLRQRAMRLADPTTPRARRNKTRGLSR
jgi:hypothetical protein